MDVGVAWVGGVELGAARELGQGFRAPTLPHQIEAQRQVQLGVIGPPTPITMINRLQITWKPEILRDLDPAPLFDMTRYVFEYSGSQAFKMELVRFKGAVT